MDFSSQLANLQKTAAAATSPRERAPGSSPHRQQQQQRRRHHHYGPYDHPRRRHGGRDDGPRRISHESNARHILATLPPFCPSYHDRHPCNAVPHVALLFITIDGLPYEHIWREWANNKNQQGGMHVSVLCHAKHPHKVTSPWLKQRLLVRPPVMGRGNEYEPPTYHSHFPEWGSIEITRAMIDLIQEGLQIGLFSRETDHRFSTNRYSLLSDGELHTQEVTPVDKLIFCSETCIPITTLEQAKEALFGKEKKSTAPEPQDSSHAASRQSMSCSPSWVHARDTPNNGYSRQLQFDKVSRAVPKVWKADQWMVLSRPHALAIMDIDGRYLPRDEPLWRFFRYCKASDELYFPTALGLLGLLHQDKKNESVLNRRVTYADWSESAKNPVSFTHGVKDLQKVAAVARNEGCLFARKFSPVHEIPGRTDNKKEESGLATGLISTVEWTNVMKELDDTTDSVASTGKEPS